MADASTEAVLALLKQDPAVRSEAGLALKEEPDTEGGDVDEGEAGDKEPEGFSLPSFDGEQPDEEPDFEAEAEEELNALANQPEPEDDEDDYAAEYGNEALHQERIKRVAAEKRAAYLENIRVKGEMGEWQKEAVRRYPLAEPFITDIDATSRRGFLKAAAGYQEKLAPFVEERIMSPIRTHLASQEEQATKDARETVERAWGKPTVGGSRVPPDADELQKKIVTAREKGSLHEGVKAMLGF